MGVVNKCKRYIQISNVLDILFIRKKAKEFNRIDNHLADQLAILSELEAGLKTMVDKGIEAITIAINPSEKRIVIVPHENFREPAMEVIETYKDIKEPEQLAIRHKNRWYKKSWRKLNDNRKRCY